MRRLVPPLLVVGAALFVAVMIWPTDRMTVQSSAGAVVPLLDIWLWGRVRSLSELSVTDVDGSVAVLTALGVAAALAIAASVLWLRLPPGRGGRRRRGTIAVVGVFAAIATAAVAVNADTGAFGWVSPGGAPTFTRTPVAVLPAVAVAFWAVALVVMVLVLLRRRGGQDEPSSGPSQT
ncbi:hypothetical protein [Terrabacter sp. Ter38]|uniref:hypothetical protein n=1 Tax=Terrabacter sp. Ter38 TaxID=2926030 RepID=UPI0021190FCB|nr:hypothetical protein [Terrabacter sp. Ter38]